MPRLSSRTLRYLALGWVLCILVLCAIPTPDLPSTGFGIDKVGHFGMFFIGALLWAQAWPDRRGYVLLAGISLAVLTEVYQGLLPLNRSMDPFDILADVLGLLAGLAVFLLRRRVPA